MHCLFVSYLMLLKDIIVHDLAIHDLVFVPIILGSNKTTVSVAIRQNNFYLLYLLIDNVHKNVIHAY